MPAPWEVDTEDGPMPHVCAAWPFFKTKEEFVAMRLAASLSQQQPTKGFRQPAISKPGVFCRGPYVRDSSCLHPTGSTQSFNLKAQSRVRPADFSREWRSGYLCWSLYCVAVKET